MRKKIAIIGSGIAGLTFANLIKTNPDFEFVIYEKEAVFNLNEGFGIQLSVNSISILNKIGFKQLNKSEKYNPTKLDFYSINLNKICDLDLAQFNSADTEYTTLKRSVLIKFLKEKLLSNSIIFRKEIRNINQLNETININFIDGSSDNVDFLIVSDDKTSIMLSFSTSTNAGAVARLERRAPTTRRLLPQESRPLAEQATSRECFKVKANLCTRTSNMDKINSGRLQQVTIGLGW